MFRIPRTCTSRYAVTPPSTVPPVLRHVKHSAPGRWEVRFASGAGCGGSMRQARDKGGRGWLKSQRHLIPLAGVLLTCNMTFAVVVLLALFVWVVRLYLRGALTSTFVGCGGVALVSSYFLDLLPFNFVVPADILYLAVSRRGRARVWLTLRQDHELLSYLCTVGVIQAPPGLEERPFGWRAVLCAVWVMLSIGVSVCGSWCPDARTCSSKLGHSWQYITPAAQQLVRVYLYSSSEQWK